MAGDSKKLQPIIVKKVKKGGHAAHGGAWKIAYADFVTAMMAFFLLMWLLGSTTEGDKKGIAEYFSSPLKIALLSSGSGAGDASHVIHGGGQDLTRTTGQVKRGEVAADRAHVNIKALKAEQIRADVTKLENLKHRVDEKIKDNGKLAMFRSQIKLDMTADGLRIQIVDAQNRPMFASGSAVVEPYMRDLLRAIGEVLAEVPNRLTLEGHTDAQPYAGGALGYSNWELSADRANASRRELIAGGLPEDRVLRVQGLASSMLLNPDDPMDPVNRRISIIVMNRDAEERFFRTTPEAAQAVDAGASASAAGAPAADDAVAASANGATIPQPINIVPQVRPQLNR
jgi:chemotaxis protein MotB